MVVGELAEPADLLVLGAGPGGYTAALAGAARGRRVVLVERDGSPAIGGTCLHAGCIPSKALIELATTVQRVRDLSDAGLRASRVAVDLVAFQERRAAIVAELGDAVRGQLERQGVEVVQGSARFTRRTRVAVEAHDAPLRYFDFTDAIIATGSSPRALPSVPFDGRTVLDAEGALALRALPRRIAVVGGGYVGVELGTAFAQLGARVAIVEAQGALLPGLDAQLVAPVAERLSELGVDVRTSVEVTGYAQGRLALRSAEGDATLAVDVVVVAVGREPCTAELGLELAGIERDADGRIGVDERMLATPHVAAVGDAVAGPALAHKAYAEARVAVDALCGDPVAFEPRAIPLVVYSDPEIVSVGMTAAQARAAGLDTATATRSLRSSGRAATLGSRSGCVTVVADRSTDRVVGVHLVGPHVSELAGEAALAIELVASPRDLADTIHPHPTIAESVAEAARSLLAGA